MNCSYLGGFFDGEGTVYETKNKVRISIPQTDYKVLENIKMFVGYGNIYKTKKKKTIHKDAWCYMITNMEGVLYFLNLIKDDVIVKKDIVDYYIKSLEIKKEELLNKTTNREIEKNIVNELKNSGLSYRKIEKIMGFSRQKVCRLINE